MRKSQNQIWELGRGRVPRKTHTLAGESQIGTADWRPINCKEGCEEGRNQSQSPPEP